MYTTLRVGIDIGGCHYVTFGCDASERPPVVVRRRRATHRLHQSPDEQIGGADDHSRGASVCAYDHPRLFPPLRSRPEGVRLGERRG